IQILDDSATQFANAPPTNYHGSIWDVAPAKRGHLKPVGQWNSQEVTCVGRRLQVVLNGTTILDVDLDELAEKRTAGKPHPGLKRDKGHIGLLGHRSRVEFRNLRIKEVSQPARSLGATSQGDTTGLTPEDIALGFVSLFDGKTLTGWEHQGGKAYVEDGALVSENGADLFYPADWSECVLECEIQGKTTKGTAICCLQLGHTDMGRGLHRVRLMFHRTGEVEVETHDGSRLWKSRHGRFPLDDWLRLRVEMTRDPLGRLRLTVSKDGTPVRTPLNIDWTPEHKGGLYFFSFGGSTARLRNVRVQTVPLPEAEAR
ncbi:MAG: 3-keto-disaccharide hydrolase, partial [Planctomycetota bacterium]